MRIEKLVIRNIRGISQVEMEDIPNTVVIAGANGCGKSCILDCIRIVKTLHGGYELNESEVLWNTILGSRQRALTYLLRDKTQDGLIEADIRLSDREKTWLRGDAGAAARAETAWRIVFPQTDLWMWRRRGILTPEMVQQQANIQRVAEQLLKGILEDTKKDVVRAGTTIRVNGNVEVTRNASLQVAWSSFVPGEIGIIDFHGSQRNYPREDLGQITLNEDDEENRWRTGTVWAYENKYSNIKSAMAGEYIRRLIQARQEGAQEEARELISEMSRLMQRFLQGKRFEGPKVRGKGEIYFPVKTVDGSEHDIDDLSAGEKEVVFGYLRAQTNTPRDSIIMIDEPELHLNPGLMRGLARFYQEGMVREGENQLWLVSHSDAFLRDAVQTTGVTVYHMQAATSAEGNQITNVDKENKVQKLLMDLVGDMATFKPKGKVLILEGTSDDQWIVETLFPEVERQATVVGGGGHTQVKAIRRVFEVVEETEGEAREVFAITDGDWGSHEGRNSHANGGSTNSTAWDRFHIENYLLEAKYIQRAIQRLSRDREGQRRTEEEIEQLMREAAEDLVEGFANEVVENRVQQQAAQAMSIKARGRQAEPKCEDVANVLRGQTVRMKDQIVQLCATDWTDDTLRKSIAAERNRLRRAVRTDAWKKVFRGRDILRKLTQGLKGRWGYDVLKGEIVRQMQEDTWKPDGMVEALRKAGIEVEVRNREAETLSMNTKPQGS